jgi:hypothetical protein
MKRSRAWKFGEDVLLEESEEEIQKKRGRQ